jgi:hypothetical protein
MTDWYSIQCGLEITLTGPTHYDMRKSTNLFPLTMAQCAPSLVLIHASLTQDNFINT